MKYLLEKGSGVPRLQFQTWCTGLCSWMCRGRSAAGERCAWLAATCKLSTGSLHKSITQHFKICKFSIFHHVWVLLNKLSHFISYFSVWFKGNAIEYSNQPSTNKIIKQIHKYKRSITRFAWQCKNYNPIIIIILLVIV